MIATPLVVVVGITYVEVQRGGYAFVLSEKSHMYTVQG